MIEMILRLFEAKAISIETAVGRSTGSIGRDDSAGDTQPQLRPPTDLRGIPAALVSLTSHGAGGNGTALPKAADTGPRGDICLAPGAVTNTAEQNQMTQNTRAAAPVQHHAA